MKYFCILGNNATLSLSEISAILPLEKGGKLIQDKVFIFESLEKIDGKTLIKNIGGVIKIGIIEKEIANKNFITSIKPILKPGVGKYKFGFSCYGQKKLNIKPLAMDIKKYLKEKGVNSRWITSKEPTLSSVVVEQNKLTAKGAEIIIISSSKKYYIGKTIAVQPFKELSFRDYGRPARDDKSGMLPPKLAQIMINLAASPLVCKKENREDKVILDPFCGSGTILTEALLMGYKNLIGSDISKTAIKNSEKNVNWVLSKYQISDIGYQFFIKQVAELSKFIKSFSIDAIVTEPYLGPQRGRIDIKKTVAELEKLYSKAFKEFKKILKKDGRIVIIFPVFTQHGRKKINPDLNGFKIINPVPEYLINNKFIDLTKRNTIIYGRTGQKIWREIVILK